MTRLTLLSFLLMTGFFYITGRPASDAGGTGQYLRAGWIILQAFPISLLRAVPNPFQASWARCLEGVKLPAMPG